MSLVYRTFDQETLDHQYNAQATVGDITPFIEMYAKGSEEARASLSCEKGLSFGPGPEETLDLFPRRRRRAFAGFCAWRILAGFV